MMNASTLKNLCLLWWLRNIAILGQTVTIGFVTYYLDFPLKTGPLWIIIAALTVINGLTAWRIKMVKDITEHEFFIQLLVDMSALFGLLYFTGGASNPFATLFILQVMIAAITLRPVYTWLAAFLTVIYYSALLYWSAPMMHLHHHDSDFFSLHIQGMWISFMLLALMVAWFVVRMNSTIRRQDALLAEAEKIAAIGTLAANAAHELGTPLATLSILSEELGEGAAPYKEQLMRCKQIISRITDAAGVSRSEGGSPTHIDMFMKTIIENWQDRNPEINLECHIAGEGVYRIIAEHGLEQAIYNLLDNAAEASPHWVRMEINWHNQRLRIVVEDRGSGIPTDILRMLGKEGVTTKHHGMGIGLLLVHSIVARFEGKLSMDTATTGTTMTISMPLKRLMV